MLLTEHICLKKSITVYTMQDNWLASITGAFHTNFYTWRIDAFRNLLMNIFGKDFILVTCYQNRIQNMVQIKYTWNL